MAVHTMHRRKKRTTSHASGHGRKKTVSKAKAKEILRHGTVHGKSLTKRQKGFFGARAGGAPVRRRRAR